MVSKYTVDPKLEDQFFNEPHFGIFPHLNMICAVIRQNRGVYHYCGYVGVPKNHPAHGMDYYFSDYEDDEDGKITEKELTSLQKAINDIHVHGGLTYARADAPGGIDNKLVKDYWWFGFDCGHFGDASPVLLNIDGIHLKNLSFGVFRDFNYVKEQTINLAEQLSKIK